MATTNIATFEGVDLPIHFSYQPYVPTKRRSTTRTANAVVVQSAAIEIIHGEGTIPFSLESAWPTEFQTLHDFYVADPSPLYRFVGYWGDEYDVYFTSLDKPQVRSKLFTFGGQFQVMRVVQSIAPTC